MSPCTYMCVYVAQSGRSLSSHVVYDADTCSTNKYQLQVINDSLRLLTYSLHSLNSSTACMYYAGISSLFMSLIMTHYYTTLLLLLFTCVKGRSLCFHVSLSLCSVRIRNPNPRTFKVYTVGHKKLTKFFYHNFYNT